MQNIFHITTNPNFKIGDTIVTSDELNPFISKLIKSIELNSSNSESGELIRFSETIHLKYDDLNSIYTGTSDEKIMKLSDRSSDFHGLSTELNNSLWHYLAYLREELFEKIRLAEFPTLPSRFKGLWLCNQSALNTWWKDFSENKNSILELSLDEDCKVLRADSNLIQTETFSINKFEEFARSYWRGKIEDEKFLEILVEGKMKIVNKFDSLEEFLNR